MSTIDPISSAGAQFAAGAAAAAASAATAAPTATPKTAAAADSQASDGIHVDISAAGRALSATQSGGSRNSDIDNSSLSDTAKALLKRIRQIRDDMARKQQEMQEVAAAQNMSPEQKQVRLEALRQAISSLSAALTTANAALAKTMENASPEEQMSAASLAMG